MTEKVFAAVNCSLAVHRASTRNDHCKIIDSLKTQKK